MAKKGAGVKTVRKKTAKKAAQRKKGGPDTIDKHVGMRVRLRRMVLGLSQDQLGKKLGLTFQQVQKYEKGVNRIGASRLFQLAEFLQVPIQFFYDDFGDIIAGPVGGLAEPDPGDNFMALVHSPEGVELFRHFSAIDDAQVKKRVLDLVKTIAETESAKPK